VAQDLGITEQQQLAETAESWIQGSAERNFGPNAGRISGGYAQLAGKQIIRRVRHGRETCQCDQRALRFSILLTNPGPLFVVLEGR
jgi:hypothetical protein